LGRTSSRAGEKRARRSFARPEALGAEAGSRKFSAENYPSRIEILSSHSKYLAKGTWEAEQDSAGLIINKGKRAFGGLQITKLI
jgi:hypothetical protein